MKTDLEDIVVGMLVFIGAALVFVYQAFGWGILALALAGFFAVVSKSNKPRGDSNHG